MGYGFLDKYLPEGVPVMEVMSKSKMKRVYINLVKFDERGYPTCEEHGAMLCVNKERSLWRCPACHIGISFGHPFVLDEWIRIQTMRAEFGIKRKGIA